MKYYLQNGEAIKANDEFSKLIAEIKESLESMTREERIAFFEKGMFAKPIRYTQEFDNTTYIVRTYFDKTASESIAEKVERVAAKSVQQK